LGDVSTSRLDQARNVRTHSWRFRLEQPHEEVGKRGGAAHEMPVQRIDSGGANSNQNFIVAGFGLLYFFKSENIGGTKVAVDDRFHAHSLLSEQLKHSPSKQIRP
jgi:hypothetical protein